MDPAEATTVQPDLAAVAAATAPAADAAPESGQGEAGTTGLYSLDSIPESIREQVLPVFKDWEANVTREFQKRADQVKAWEPYDQLGVRDIAPEDMQHLVSFYELASDEDAFKNWVQEAASTLGILEAAPQGAGTEGGHEAGVAAAVQAQGEAAGMSSEKVQQMIAEAIQQDRQTREQEQEQQAQVDALGRQVRETLDSFDIPGEKPEDKQRVEELVCFMAQKHQDGQRSVEEVLKAGFADYQRMVNGNVSDALDGKLKQPAATAVTEGQANTSPKPANSFDEASARLRERLRAA